MTAGRSTRLVALMAGNGFGFAQILGHYLDRFKDKSPSLLVACTYVVLALVAFSGVSTSYLALYEWKQGNVARRLEVVSTTTVVLLMFYWCFWAIYQGVFGQPPPAAPPPPPP